MNRISIVLVMLFATVARAGAFQPKQVELFCHRTANEDMPENTLESLALAARMGCNLVEIDIRRTLDGKLVLNHDGILDRLTSGIGTVEETSSDELGLVDPGAWMGQRFMNMHIPSFDEALEVAREQGIRLSLDIKTKDERPLIYEAVKRHGMLDRVIFGGEWDDIRALYPIPNSNTMKFVPPGSTAEQITALQRQGNFVVVNFSANPQEMDMPSMRAAVAAGADAINVDYPRLGADAVGRPVETKLAVLVSSATDGPIQTRTAAIRELSRYQGFPTQPLFARWLRDPEDQISRAAAVALVLARPHPPTSVFVEALSAPEKAARKNAAWALGIMGLPATASLLPLLKEKDPELQTEALLALSRCPGTVPADRLVPLLASDNPLVRGAAALALVRHHPEIASHAVPASLARAERVSVQIHTQIHTQHVSRNTTVYTQQEADSLSTNFREQMKLIQALEGLPSSEALHQLATQGLAPLDQSSSMNALVAGYQLWDRIAADPALAIQALSSADGVVANRAEWVLVKAGPAVLPAVRQSLHLADPATRERLVRILAWQGDSKSLPMLRDLRVSDPRNGALIDWATQKIQNLSFKP
jgi:Glycerophosphoryl diester phosphodiesterase family